MAKCFTIYRFLSFVVGILSATTVCLAQTSLNSPDYGIREGDIVHYSEFQYSDEGLTGANMMWNFNSLKSTSYGKYAFFSAMDGHTKSVDSQKLYSFLPSTDSVLLLTVEDPLNKISYESPINLLTFPLQYGQTISTSFFGKGQHCNRIPIKEHGTSQTTFDAYGTIILPNNDTIRNVMRVHNNLSSDLDIYKHSNDSLTFHKEENRFMWLARGCRYPIFEIHRCTYRHEDEVVYKYSVSRQLKYVYTNGGNDSLSIESIKQSEQNIAKLLRHTVAVNGENLIVDYSLSQDATLKFTICDGSGIVFRTVSACGTTGDCHTTISLQGLRHGQYVLYINADGIVSNNKFTYK